MPSTEGGPYAAFTKVQHSLESSLIQLFVLSVAFSVNDLKSNLLDYFSCPCHYQVKQRGQYWQEFL